MELEKSYPPNNECEEPTAVALSVRLSGIKPMRNFQKLLLDALQQNHWSFDEVIKPEHWWAADIWAISSTRQQYGLRLFVTFIADPATLGCYGLAGASPRRRL